MQETSLAKKRLEVLWDIAGCTMCLFVAAMFMYSFVADADEEKEMQLLRISAPAR